jgi:glycosyltransferase involved in cell wall biosynthesis
LRYSLLIGFKKFDKLLIIVLAPFFIALSSKIHFGTRKKANVLIIMEDKYSVSAVNRAYNLAEYLKNAGYSPKVATMPSALFELFRQQKYSIIVMQRTVINRLTQEFLTRAQKIVQKTVYDCDDLLFAPEYADRVSDNIDSGKAWMTHELEIHEQVMKRCEYFLTSTDMLAKVAQEKGMKTYILRNGLNKTYLEKCENILAAGKKSNEKVVIGYQSGTGSHNFDFSFAAPALLKIMQEFPNVWLYVFGYLNLPKEFDSSDIRRRVQKHGFVSFLNMPTQYKNFDIAIVPLEVGNPFVESKSELKYVYAGALDIPCVASPSEAYRYAIQDGINGYLAKDDKDWYDKLRMLVVDVNIRETMGRNAYNHVIENYSAQELSNKAGQIFDEINLTV